MTGSQYRDADGWIDNPIYRAISIFMSTTVPPGFNPQNVPYLANVTSLTGFSFNALAAVPTIALPVPFIVKIAITGDQDYQLIAGVFTGPGYVTPNDQASSLKTWQQIS